MMPYDQTAGSDEGLAEARQHPKPSKEILGEVRRVLGLVRFFIQQRGFTQLEVQAALGWGRTYISQLLREQKSLRYDQVLQILQVIEVHPLDFFVRLYSGPPSLGARPRILSEQRGVLAPGDIAKPWRAVAAGKLEADEPSMGGSLHHVLALLAALIDCLEAKQLLDRDELARALAEREKYGTAGPALEALLVLGDDAGVVVS